MTIRNPIFTSEHLIRNGKCTDYRPGQTNSQFSLCQNFICEIHKKSKFMASKMTKIAVFVLLKLSFLILHKVSVPRSENLWIFNTFNGGIFTRNQFSTPPKWPKLHFYTIQNYQISHKISLSLSENCKLACPGLYHLRLELFSRYFSVQC